MLMALATPKKLCEHGDIEQKWFGTHTNIMTIHHVNKQAGNTKSLTVRNCCKNGQRTGLIQYVTYTRMTGLILTGHRVFI